jgi:serine/threonine protein kinase
MILELFRKEARILNHLAHDAIVRYYVFSIDSAIGRPYLAMEFVDGQSLAERTKTSPLAVDDFTYLLKRLADGLDKAHDAGVIHRDMSPDNVILPGGLVKNAKIIDFGIARSAKVGGATLLGGSFAGKYNYVSPEQLGLFGGEVTPKSDIYSLALVMAGALRGKPLDMNGSQVEVIEKRRTVPELVGVPKQFHDVLTAMLQPDPAARPANMAAVRDWTESAASQSRSQGKPAETKREKKSPAPKIKAELQASAEPETPIPHSTAMRNFTIIAGVISMIGIGALAGWLYVRDQVEIENPNITATETPEAKALPPGPAHPESRPTESNPLELKPADIQPPPKVEQVAPVNVEPKQPAKVDQVPPTKIEPTQQANKNPKSTDKIKPKSAQPDTIKPEIDLTKIAPAEQKTAELAPAPQAKNQPPTLAQLQSFVEDYGSGTCLNIDTTSLSATTAEFNLLGTAETVNAFRTAFSEKAGFTPQVKLQSVSDKQCSFVSLLRKMSDKEAKPLELNLGATEIVGRNPDTGAVGDALKLTVKYSDNQNIYLFVMDHEGGIQNINRLCPTCITMKIGEMNAALSMTIPPTVDGQISQEYYPTLVFAVASNKPLISINSQDAFDADAFIEPFLKEIDSGNNIVSTKAAFIKLKSQ